MNGTAPDILDCLANLSSDEVFTPPALVGRMLDLLPKSLWRNPNARFLDPFSKSGVFLREIARRLDAGLESRIPDREERVRHIFSRQVYGIAITRLTALFSRRTLYCNKDARSEKSNCFGLFRSEGGNIAYRPCRHDWAGGSCRLCGASEKAWGATSRSKDVENYAYPFLHDERLFMDSQELGFDVVIGNPPYQMSDGGDAGGALPIYNRFVEQAIRLNPRYLVMIIPSRWFAGGRGLDAFREKMRHDHRIKTLVDYPKSRDCFSGVDIAGGVCYFLWDRQYNGPCNFCSRQGGEEDISQRFLDELDVIIRDSRGVSIIHKVLAKKEQSLSSSMLTISPFGLRSFTRGNETKARGDIVVISSGGKGFIKRNEVSKNANLIDKYKLYVGYLNPDRAGVNNAADGKSNVITKIKYAMPGEVLTETYIVPYYDADFEKVQNCGTYLSTKFSRLLILLTLSSMHIAQANLAFVPIQDFSKPWTDEELYAKYGLDEKEIAFIEAMIRPMEA